MIGPGMIKLFIFLTLSVVSVQSKESDTLSGVIDGFEETLRSLSKAVDEEWKSIMTCDLICDTCSYDGCLSSFEDDGFCDEDVTMEACIEKRDDCHGMMKSRKSSTSFADEVGQDSEDENVRATVCMSNHLEATMKNLFDPDTMDSIYIGFYNGVFFMYPGQYQQGCFDYDPRIRPWFVAASSGPKNIILILDVSGSMNQPAHALEDMKGAAISVLETLTFADYFGVVMFNHVAEVITPQSVLIPATSANKIDAQERIQGMMANGATNFEDAFLKTFSLLDESAIAEGAMTDCGETILMFLTDGEPTEGLTDKAAISQLVSNRNEPYNASIFTYSFGAGASGSEEISKEISCKNGGIHQTIDQTSGTLASSMSSYYEYLSSGVQTRDHVSWVEPYIYSTTGETGTSASLAVFDQSTDHLSFLGVIGVDLLSRDLEEMAEGESLIQRLSSRSIKCMSIDVDECRLESLRGVEDRCETCPDHQPILHPPQTCDGPGYYSQSICNENRANEDLQYEDMICCPCGRDDPTGAIIGGTLGGVFGCCCCFILIFYMAKKEEKTIKTRVNSIKTRFKPVKTRFQTTDSTDESTAYCL